MPQPHGHQPPPRIPRTQDLPHPAPPPRDPLDRIWLDPATTERAQGIRSDAANVASMLLGDCSGTSAGIAARLVELAEPIADWIRDGTRPGTLACICPPVDVSPVGFPLTEFVRGEPHAQCPQHGSRS